jgi:uncharacterized membrane protein YidH (DUF202 family)
MTPPHAEGAVFDVSLQLERTHLAWNRTAFAFAVNALLLARFSRHVHPAGLGLVSAAGLSLVGIAAWWYGRTAYAGRSASLIAGRSPLRPRVLLMFSCATTVLLLVVVLVSLTAIM